MVLRVALITFGSLLVAVGAVPPSIFGDRLGRAALAICLLLASLIVTLG